MTIRNYLRAGTLLCLILPAACGHRDAETATPVATGYAPGTGTPAAAQSQKNRDEGGTKIWSLFQHNDDANVTLQVNKYLWNASLEVLNFLPIQSVDPFSGVIVTGYGTPPGGGRAYRATIQISDPALDARSLKVALESKGGAVSPDTVHAVEDAILTRARQLRVADSHL